MSFQVATFLMISCFYFAYFYKQFRLRKKGIRTNRLAKGSKPNRTAIIESFLLAATYVTAVIQYASVFWPAYMLPLPSSLPVRIAGLILNGFGVTCFIAAVFVMRDSWRAGIDEEQKTAIVTKGIYKYSRNPAFLGFDLLYIGTFLAVPNVIMLAAAIIAICLLHLQILEEEKFLPSFFGDDYKRYKQNTPRYLLFF